MMNSENKLSDTEWLVAAVKAEIDSLGIADRVESCSCDQFEIALEAFREVADKVIYIVPGDIACDHTLQAGYAIKAAITRKVCLLIGAGQPGDTKGDMEAATRLMDQSMNQLMWCQLGVDNMICLPKSATPVQITYEDAPGRMVWRLDVDVQDINTNI